MPCHFLIHVKVCFVDFQIANIQIVHILIQIHAVHIARIDSWLSPVASTGNLARMYNEASHCSKVFSVNQHIIAVGNAIKTQMLIMSDICLPAHAEGKISQCLSACLIRIHLALWIIRR